MVDTSPPGWLNVYNRGRCVEYRESAIYDPKRNVILLRDGSPFPALEERIVDGVTSLHYLPERGKREPLNPISDGEARKYR
jgi:hypothetical protein